MQNPLMVRWTIVPAIAPQPHIACSTCGGLRPFKSSDRLRLNANGKKLDAWLIYKCTLCEKTWNRPLFERRNVRDIDPATLQALQTNDAQWARRHAFDIEGLRRKAQRIDSFAECTVHKAVLAERADWNSLQICLSVPMPCQLRLDRLLATELNLSRSRFQTLHAAGTVHIHPEHKDSLRRPARDGGCVVIDVSGLPDREALCGSACGRL